MVTLDAAADYLNVSKDYLSQLVKSGHLRVQGALVDVEMLKAVKKVLDENSYEAREALAVLSLDYEMGYGE